MYLLKLSSNQPSFKEVKFNKYGLSIIKGVKTSNDPNKTYNGVGKSLLIRIIDFCLGSNEIKAFKKLVDWEFNLLIEVDEKQYVLNRSVDNQKIIKINEVPYDLEGFRNFFQSKIFPMDRKMKFLTFRSLISRFLRPRKTSYSSFDSPVHKEQEYSKLLNLCYLLAIDLDLVEGKMEETALFKEEKKKYQTLIKDSSFKKVFKNEKKLNIRIVNLKSDLVELEEKLKAFKFSDGYVQIMGKKEDTTKQLKKIQNDLFIVGV